MKLNGKQLLICDCEGTIDLPQKELEKLFDGDEVVVNTHLCRSQIGNFTVAVEKGDPLIVACTQEAPLFVEMGAEANEETPISYTNIRERAGWSEEGDQALPKIRALIEEATLQAPLAASVSMASAGRVASS